MNKPAQFPPVTVDTGGAARFTAAEFLHMVEAGAFDDMNVELVEGELQRMPPAGNSHSRRHGSVAFRLMSAVGEALVRIEAGVQIDDGNILGPDVALLTRAVAEDGPLPVDSVALAVEVAESSIDRDLGVKRLLYAGAGIPHYWVVDGKRFVTHVFERPVDGDYSALQLVSFGKPLAVPGTDATIILD
jgi:Uma2 family endonuclease